MTTYKNGLHKILNDDGFWKRFLKLATQKLKSTMTNSKATGYIPRSDAFNRFVDIYILIKDDKRPRENIKLELMEDI